MSHASTKTILIILAVYLLTYCVFYSIGGKDYIIVVAIVTSILALLFGFIGLILMISQNSRKAGADIFISCLLILLIGFGICTSGI